MPLLPLERRGGVSFYGCPCVRPRVPSSMIIILSLLTRLSYKTVKTLVRISPNLCYNFNVVVDNDELIRI